LQKLCNFKITLHIYLLDIYYLSKLNCKNEVFFYFNLKNTFLNKTCYLTTESYGLKLVDVIKTKENEKKQKKLHFI